LIFSSRHKMVKLEPVKNYAPKWIFFKLVKDNLGLT